MIHFGSAADCNSMAMQSSASPLKARISSKNAPMATLPCRHSSKRGIDPAGITAAVISDPERVGLIQRERVHPGPRG